MLKGKVLVTGRYGFTGRYVASALETAGWQVWGTCSHSTERMGPLDIVADLTDATSVRKLVNSVRPDTVVHLAGISFVNYGNINDIYKINLLGTRNLLEALSLGGYGKAGVVLASSANVYGDSISNPISEISTPAPKNDYAVSKLAMEYVAKLFEGEMPITIARAFNYTGVGQDQKFLVPKIVSHFRNRASLIELGNLNIARDYSDVRDVAEVYSRLLDVAKPWGKHVNICSGNAISLKSILEICQNLSGHEIEIVINPRFVRKNDLNILNGDPAALHKMIGDFSRYSFEDTLRWMLSA